MCHKRLCEDFKGLGFVELPNAPSLFQKWKGKFGGDMFLHMSFDNIILFAPSGTDIILTVKSLNAT